ncbi:MAG: hypothetical protein HC888_00590 [Candidatus Competibacteraceae bacterium]|nr:hypothetical protein [Candidatus Competibacteraceae bacterium]
MKIFFFRDEETDEHVSIVSYNLAGSNFDRDVVHFHPESGQATSIKILMEEAMPGDIVYISNPLHQFSPFSVLISMLQRMAGSGVRVICPSIGYDSEHLGKAALPLMTGIYNFYTKVEHLEGRRDTSRPVIKGIETPFITPDDFDAPDGLEWKLVSGLWHLRIHEPLVQYAKSILHAVAAKGMKMAWLWMVANNVVDPRNDKLIQPNSPRLTRLRKILENVKPGTVKRKQTEYEYRFKLPVGTN